MGNYIHVFMLYFGCQIIREMNMYELNCFNHCEEQSPLLGIGASSWTGLVRVVVFYHRRLGDVYKSLIPLLVQTMNLYVYIFIQ